MALEKHTSENFMFAFFNCLSVSSTTWVDRRALQDKVRAHKARRGQLARYLDHLLHDPEPLCLDSEHFKEVKPTLVTQRLY